MDNKVQYRAGDGIVEVIVRSETGAKEDFFRANLNDKKNLILISTLLYDKYGIDLTPLSKRKETPFDFDF